MNLKIPFVCKSFTHERLFYNNKRIMPAPNPWYIVSVACSYFVFLLSSLSDNSKSSDKYLPKIASALTTACNTKFF